MRRMHKLQYPYHGRVDVTNMTDESSFVCSSLRERLIEQVNPHRNIWRGQVFVHSCTDACIYLPNSEVSHLCSVTLTSGTPFHFGRNTEPLFIPHVSAATFRLRWGKKKKTTISDTEHKRGFHSWFKVHCLDRLESMDSRSEGSSCQPYNIYSIRRSTWNPK